MSRTVTKLPEHPCPFCGAPISAMSDPFDAEAVPSPGAAGVCLKCANVAILGDDGAMRKPTDAELIDLAGAPDMRRTIFLVASFNAAQSATQADLDAFMDAAHRVADGTGVLLLSEIAAELGWDKAKAYGVMTRVQQAGHGVILHAG